MWWFDLCLHCETMTTIKLINTPIASLSYHFKVFFHIFLTDLGTWCCSGFLAKQKVWYVYFKVSLRHKNTICAGGETGPSVPPLQPLAQGRGWFTSLRVSLSVIIVQRHDKFYLCLFLSKKVSFTNMWWRWWGHYLYVLFKWTDIFGVWMPEILGSLD